jgi:hypothetical protein
MGSNTKRGNTAVSIVKIGIAMTLFGVLTSIAGGFIGYNLNKYSSEANLYHTELNELSHLMIAIDASTSGSNEVLNSTLIGMAESSFSQMVFYFPKIKNEQSSRVRCALTRKIRILEQQNLIYQKVIGGYYRENPIPEEVLNYLNTKCVGDPSHSNWSNIEPIEPN